MAEVNIFIKAKNMTKTAINEVKKSLKGLGDSTDKTGKQTKSFADTWSMALMGINQGIAIARQAAQAFEQVYSAARAGAELEYTEDRFERLALSIGTTADALEDDLGEATRGLYSDAELMNSAMDFMALGLAKSHDEAVRLATVAGGLNMNMNQLVLTLTNMTTMRFDAIGVSVDGFKEKVKALEAQGYSTNDAFKEAFLRQAEDQIERVGEAADSNVGSFMRMEAAWNNVADSYKKRMADAIAPALEDYANYLETVTDFHDEMTDAVERGIITEEEYERIINDARHSANNKAEALEWLTEETEAYENSLEFANIDIGYMRDNLERAGKTSEEIEIILGNLREETDDTAEATLGLADGIITTDEAMKSYNDTLLFNIASQGLSEEAAFALAESMGLVDERTIHAMEQTSLYQQMLDDGKISLETYNTLVSNLADELSRIKDRDATVTITTVRRTVYKSAAADEYHWGDGNAAGGLIKAAAGTGMPAPYWVGEIGPEPFFPASDGRILSNSQAMSAMRSGDSGKSAINITINTPINLADRAFIEQEFAPLIEDVMRKRR